MTPAATCFRPDIPGINTKKFPKHPHFILLSTNMSSISLYTSSACAYQCAMCNGLQGKINLFLEPMERVEQQKQLRYYVTMAFTILLSILLFNVIIQKIQDKIYRRAEIRKETRAQARQWTRVYLLMCETREPETGG